MNTKTKIILIVFFLIVGTGLIISGFFFNQNSHANERKTLSNPGIAQTISGKNVSVYLGTFGNITFNTSLPESPGSLSEYTGVLGPGDHLDESYGSSIGDGINVPMGTEAYAIALTKLDANGGVPQDAVPCGATTNYAELVNRTTFDVVRRYAEDTMVSFTRRINGRYVMGDTDIIRVDLGDNGRLIWIYKEWRNYTYSGDVRIIPVETAVKKLENGDTINQYLTPKDDVNIYNISLGYYVKGLEEPLVTLEPVWIFSGNTPSGSGVSFKVYARQFANFTSSPPTGKVPLKVAFNDTSEASPVRWYWDFGDGTNSTEQNPVHTFTTAGTFNISLKAWNDLGSDLMEKPVYITFRNPAAPAASFTGTVVSK